MIRNHFSKIEANIQKPYTLNGIIELQLTYTLNGIIVKGGAIIPQTDSAHPPPHPGKV